MCIKPSCVIATFLLRLLFGSWHVRHYTVHVAHTELRKLEVGCASRSPDGAGGRLVEREVTWWSGRSPRGAGGRLMEREVAWWSGRSPRGAGGHLMEREVAWWSERSPDGAGGHLMEREVASWSGRSPFGTGGCLSLNATHGAWLRPFSLKNNFGPQTEVKSSSLRMNVIMTAAGHRGL